MLHDKTIAITGASRGIGQACAIALADFGIKLILMSRNQDDLKDTARICEEKGAKTFCFGFDLSQIDTIEHNMLNIKNICGNIDILVNNAGIWLEKPFMKGNLKDWDKAIDVNLKAPIHLTYHALEGMPSGGSIIFIGSVASKKTYAKGTNYCATKYGLLGFAGALFEDVRERGIKVCSILPGSVNTDMHTDDTTLDKEKLINPQDIANSVLFVLNTPMNICPIELTVVPQKNPKQKI